MGICVWNNLFIEIFYLLFECGSCVAVTAVLTAAVALAEMQRDMWKNHGK